MDTKTYTIDNYVGLDKSKVKSSYFKFEFIGEGNMVIDQLPKYGEKIEEWSTYSNNVGVINNFIQV